MTEYGKLKLREKLSYGFGDLASVLYWQTFMAYLMIFYTDTFGISASVFATMMLVGRLWDGVNDPMMGILADRTKTRWGKFRPYLLWICVPFALFGVLTFTTPNISEGGKVVWAYVTFMGLMMLYTAINIPYTAMLGVMTPNSAERTSLASVKFLFAFSAGTIISFGLLPAVKALSGAPKPCGVDTDCLSGHCRVAEGVCKLSGAEQAGGYQTVFIIIGAAAVLFFAIAFLGTNERVAPPKVQKSSIVRDVKDLLSNKPWLILLLTTITFILFVATRMTATAHYFKYFVGEQRLDLPFMGGPRLYEFEELVSVFNGSGQIASILGVLLVSWFAGKVGKKRAFILLFVVSVVATAAFYVAKPEQLLLIFGLNLVGSLTGGPLSVVIWAMYADSADYAEWKDGRRATGLVFSASTMSQKAGWAVGSAVAGWLLAAVGFQPNVAQNDDVRHGLVLLVSLIPAALGVLSIAIVLFYPLSDELVAKIEQELRQRRAAADAEASLGAGDRASVT